MVRALRVIFLVFALLAPGYALDREAFTITTYDLEVRIEPQQQRLGVRGKITLRNDSSSPQKNLSLQLSSSLEWRSIQSGGKPVQFVSQTYTSDIDHTGALSEAVLTLTAPVAPQGKVDLDVGYEGTVRLDETRLTRIGVPEAAAKHSDWDEIGKSFIGLRGIGYVAWYPVATESANLSEGETVFETVGRWKQRERQSIFRVRLCVEGDAFSPLMNDPAGSGDGNKSSNDGCSEHAFEPLAMIVPAIVAGDYDTVSQPFINIHYLPGRRSAAEEYSVAAALALPFVKEWFGNPHENAEVAELADGDAAPFETGALLLMPLGGGDSRLAQTTAVHQLTHAAFSSPRPWIYEGVAHFAQAAEREQRDGRQAALDFMGLHRPAIIEAEKALAASPATSVANESLINNSNEEFYRSKAMYVWWMLRDMVGESALKRALGDYQADKDKSASYIQQLIAAQSKKDLEWFFDDWVYRDRGLPDFRVESVYPRATLSGGYVTTISVENLGNAGAEVPVTMRIEGGDITRRVEVRAKGKGAIRIESATLPQEVVVNDGSVPESDMTNNVFEVAAPPK